MNLFRTLFFYFLIYSFLGWIIEGLFNLYKRGHFSKPNFLMFPIKPMYGIAAVILVQLAPKLPFWLFLLSCLIVPVIVEYLTAFLLYSTFALKYWDYTAQPYQLSGFICLKFALYWWLLAFILVTYLHPFFIAIYTMLSPLWFYFFPILLLLFITDIFYTINTKRLKHL